MLKILVVDDSALMRRQLTLLFEAQGDMVVRQARNGAEAVAENHSFQPDVVTLDINMPEMDGITALSLIMTERPVPVVMVSSLTEKGALATFEALNLGAVDYVAKPGGTISLSLEVVKADLLAKVRMAAKVKLGRMRTGSTGVVTGLSQRMREERQRIQSNGMVFRRPANGEGLVLIGVSTGGPRALEEVLPQLPADLPWPVLVAQHMPASFTAPFAARLGALCSLPVMEVNKPQPVQPGHVYIGKGGADMVLAQRGEVLTALPKPESPECLWHPSVEMLARSAMQVISPERILAVMLTGMGYDGADAFTDIKRAGGRTIAEAEETAVVFGMPGELIARGGATVVLPLGKVANQVKAWVNRF